MSKILFVCLGNICRSPLAEGVARTYLRTKGLAWEVDSAGTSSYHVGEPPCDYSLKIAKMHHIDISPLRAREVKRSDAEKFDHIVAMDRANRRSLEAIGFKRVYLLGDFGGYRGKDVPDPYFFNSFDDGIKSLYTMIATCVEDFIEKAIHETL